MKNKEKYLTEILESFANNTDNCSFRKNYILKKSRYNGISCKECNNMVKEWLNAEYKEPSKKIKLTEFEYDLLDSNDQSRQRTIGSFQTYENMRQRGYFENIPFDKSIEYVLENCEVITR